MTSVDSIGSKELWVKLLELSHLGQFIRFSSETFQGGTQAMEEYHAGPSNNPLSSETLVETSYYLFRDKSI